MKRTVSISICIICLISLLACSETTVYVGNNEAPSIVPYVFEELLEQSDVIAEVEITENLGETNDPDYRTYFKADVITVLKGASGLKTLNFIQGVNSNYSYDGYRVFGVGDKLVLFLSKVSDEDIDEDTYWIRGDYLSVIRVDMVDGMEYANKLNGTFKDFNFANEKNKLTSLRYRKEKLFTLIRSMMPEYGGLILEYDFDSEKYEDIVFGIMELHSSVIRPETIEEILQMLQEFDVNIYFDILKHIELKDGFTFDYYYDTNPAGSYPKMYFVDSNQYDSDTDIEYSTDANGEIYLIEPPHKKIGSFAYRDFSDLDKCIELDGSPESYIEYTILDILGGQFALWGAALGNDKTPVFSKALIEHECNHKRISYISTLDTDEALQLAAAPKIEMTDNEVYVTVMYFTSWGGFINRTYCFETDEEFRLRWKKEKTILKYDCGMIIN